MSIEAMQWAFNQDIKPSSVKFVLVSLGDNAQGDGLAWPSIAALSQKTGQDRKTVMHALDKLESMGYLADTGKRTGSTGQIKVYKFNFHRANSATNGTVIDNSQHTEVAHKSAEIGTVEEAKEYRFSHQTVPNFPPNSTVFPPKSTENGTRNPQEPSMEPSRNRQYAVAGEISKAMRDHGILCQPADPRIIALAEQGVEVETVQAACKTARESKGTESIGLGYIVAILGRWSREAAGVSAKGAFPPVRASPTSARAEKFDPLAYVNRNRSRTPNDERTIDLDANGEPV